MTPGHFQYEFMVTHFKGFNRGRAYPPMAAAAQVIGGGPGGVVAPHSSREFRATAGTPEEPAYLGFRLDWHGVPARTQAIVAEDVVITSAIPPCGPGVG